MHYPHPSLLQKTWEKKNLVRVYKLLTRSHGGHMHEKSLIQGNIPVVFFSKTERKVYLQTGDTSTQIYISSLVSWHL